MAALIHIIWMMLMAPTASMPDLGRHKRIVHERRADVTSTMRMDTWDRWRLMDFSNYP